MRGRTVAFTLSLGLLASTGAAHAQAPRSAEVVAESVSANCRALGATPEATCDTPLGPRVRAAAVDAFQGSWVDRALALQYDLAGDVGLRNAPFIGTHNSFNSVAEMGPALSPNDSNQQLTVTDQLRLDVRALELDVHRFFRLQAAAFVPVVCHARGGDQAHAGCSTEKPLADVLQEILAWLRAHPDQVVLLDLEDHLDTPEGYDDGARVVDSVLGDVIFRPQGDCETPPLDLTRDAVRAAGKQVLITTGCDGSAAWSDLGFDRDARVERRPRGFEDFPSCGPDFDRATYGSGIVRYYGDSTLVGAAGSAVEAAEPDDGITPATAARMARCGVDRIGMDQLLPGDGRLEALVWSWARGEPAVRRNGDCAVQRASGRWEARTCNMRRPVACRGADGRWSVAAAPVAPRAAQGRCAQRDAVHAVPRTGYEGQLLRVAMEAVGADVVLLGLRRVDGRWTAVDER